MVSRSTPTGSDESLGHSTTGACQTNDFGWQLTKLSIELGAAPIIDFQIDMTPVDFAVAALVRLSLRPELRGQISHVVSDSPITLRDLSDWMEKYGYSGERISSVAPSDCADAWAPAPKGRGMTIVEIRATREEIVRRVGRLVDELSTAP